MRLFITRTAKSPDLARRPLLFRFLSHHSDKKTKEKENYARILVLVFGIITNN